MMKITINFKTRVDTGNSFKAIGYIYLNNGFIVRQEIKILEARVSTRTLNRTKNGYKVDTNTYVKMIKKSTVRKDVLKEHENRIPGDNKPTVTKSLAPNQLKDLESVINNSKSGTLLSTLMGLLSYTSVTGSDKSILNSPIVIDGGKFDGFRFYNLFTNEFHKSTQSFVETDDYDDLTIEQWINLTKANRLMFALYNYDNDPLFLSNCGISITGFSDKTYDDILSIVAKKSRRENDPDIVELYRRVFKKNVMNEPKYKFDFIFNDTNKENTEAAHIYEVNAIKKLESPDDWQIISDVDNCLLLTPSVHRAWDKEQIYISQDGEIKNKKMESKRFERLFKPANFKVNFDLNDKQKEYLEKRKEIGNFR